jgi:hypothetical protein
LSTQKRRFLLKESGCFWVVPPRLRIDGKAADSQIKKATKMQNAATKAAFCFCAIYPGGNNHKA